MGGCNSKATKKFSKTAKINEINATQHKITTHYHRRWLCTDINKKNKNNDNDDIINSVWSNSIIYNNSINCTNCNKNNNSNNSNINNKIKIIIKHNPATLILITMTLVTATILQMANNSVDAAAVRLSSASMEQTPVIPFQLYQSSNSNNNHNNNNADDNDDDNDNDNNINTHYNIANNDDYVDVDTNANINMRRTRLRKRHSNYLYFHNNLHESTTSLEWQNPCGGVYEPNVVTAIEQQQQQQSSAENIEIRPPVKHYMKMLRRATLLEYRTINETLHTIDTSDLEMWKLHRYHYQFLPSLKRNSSIALKRWYRNMQTYVASFAYLGRTQYTWDSTKLMHAGKVTHELNELFMSARRMLCEIEASINGSYPLNNQDKLTTVSREIMNKRLKFRTRKHAGTVVEADMIDLKFLKQHYYDFLTTMWKILRRNTKRQGQIAIHDGSESAPVDENVSQSGNVKTIHNTSDGSASESVEKSSPATASHRRRTHSSHNRGSTRRRQEQHLSRQSINSAETNEI